MAPSRPSQGHGSVGAHGWVTHPRRIPGHRARATTGATTRQGGGVDIQMATVPMSGPRAQQTDLPRRPRGANSHRHPPLRSPRGADCSSTSRLPLLEQWQATQAVCRRTTNSPEANAQRARRRFRGLASRARLPGQTVATDQTPRPWPRLRLVWPQPRPAPPCPVRGRRHRV